MKTIGEKIKKLRSKHKWTQKELAEKLNISRSAITNWENGRNYPDIQLIINISELFNISLDELLKGDKVVVEKITNDTKNRKKQTTQLRVFNFLGTVLVLLFLCFGIPAFIHADIFSMNQIKSVEVTENNLVIETDLPFYREYTGYMLSSSLANPWNMELHIGTTISFSKNKDNIIVIPLDDSQLFGEMYGIEFVNSFGNKYNVVRIDNR
jgi:transcriptional regulator with XRE-family HTH domain